MKLEVAERLAEKVADVRMKNYIAQCGEMKSDIDYFGAIKILSNAGVVLDIKVVWDATQLDLNQKIWVLNFMMLIVNTTLCLLS